MTFPVNAVLDNFTRADGGIGSGWGVLNSYSQFVIRSNAVSVAPSPAFMYYKTQYTATQEVYVTVLDAAQTVRLLLRVADPTTSASGYYAEFTGTAWSIKTIAGATVDSGTFAGYAAGDKLGFAASETTLSVYHYDADGAAVWVEIDNTTDATYNRAGYIGLGYDNGGTAETLGVISPTPTVGCQTGSVTTSNASAVFVNNAVEFDIEAAGLSADNPFGTILSVGQFPASYITYSLDAGTQYIQTVEVVGGEIVTTTGDFSRVGFLGHPAQKPELTTDDIYFTPAFFGSTSEQYWDFFLKAETTQDPGNTTTATIDGTWRVQVWELATLSGLTALFDDFGGGAYNALTGVVLSGPCGGKVTESLTYTATITPSNATEVVYLWSADGLQSGQGTTTAIYNWNTAGIKTVTITATDGGGVVKTDTREEVYVSAATIREDIYNIVNAVADTGNVYSYGRWAVLRPDFLSLFKVTIDSVAQIRGFFIEAGTFSEERSDFRETGASGLWRTWQFHIHGYLSWNDALTTEKTMATLVESVANALDNSDLLHANCAYYNADPVQLIVYEPRMWGNELCHYVHLLQAVTEWIG